MLRDLLSNRTFMGALAFFVLMIVGGMLYLKHVERRAQEKIAHTNEIVKQLNDQKANPLEAAEVPEGDAARGGHFHADGTWHAEPHTENPTRGKPMTIEETIEKYEQLKRREALLTQQKERLLKELHAGEVRISIDKIFTQGNALTDAFPDVIQMTPEKYLVLSTDEKEKFLQRADKYDAEVEALYDIVSKSPQELQDELETLKPEVMHRMRLASSISLSDFYRGLEQK